MFLRYCKIAIVVEASSEGLFRKIPAVGRLLEHPDTAQIRRKYPHALVVCALHRLLDELRAELHSKTINEEELGQKIDGLPSRLDQLLTGWTSFSLRPVINATGVILFTNAGRAPLAREAAEHVAAIASNYSNLEFDLQEGRRGRRDFHFESRAVQLFQCEAATVCNNAAAAVFLILDTLAAGRKVIVSRGELIEIGGSFRIPEILKKSGARLTEVGTTNKTRLADYSSAIDEETAMILRVHPSNYKIIGFTQRPELEELVALARRAGVLLVHDLGSGCLTRTGHRFLACEPTVEESLRIGVDLLCFSGDKLLGGPQAGLIAGRKHLIERIRRNPLMRICRADKMTYSALEWTLLQYQTEAYPATIPVWKMMRADAEEIAARCRRFLQSVKAPGLQIELREGFSVTGGGSAPEERIPTMLLAVSSENITANRLEHRLRARPIPVLVRIEEEKVLIDLRTVLPDQEEELAAALSRAAELESQV